MNINRRALSILCVTLVFACSSKEASQQSDEEVRFDNEVTVMDHLDTMKIDRSLLVSYALVTNDEFLFSMTDKSDPVVRVFDHKTGKYLGGFGKNGAGPGEFELINRSGFTRFGNNIVVTTGKYIRSFDVNLDQKGFTWKMESEGKMPGELIPLNSAFILNDTVAAGTKTGATSLLSTFNMKSGEIGRFTDYPDFEPEIPKTAYHHLYRSHSRISPDRRKIATVFSNYPLLRIHDTETGTFQDVFITPNNEQKKVVAAPNGRSIDSFALYKFLDKVEVNEYFILAKYGESELVPKAEGNGWDRNQLVDQSIMVFDWEGKPIIKLYIEDWMYQYTITPDNRIIFFHPEEKDELYVIDLKPLID